MSRAYRRAEPIEQLNLDLFRESDETADQL